MNHETVETFPKVFSLNGHVLETRGNEFKKSNFFFIFIKKNEIQRFEILLKIVRLGSWFATLDCQINVPGPN